MIQIEVQRNAQISLSVQEEQGIDMSVDAPFVMEGGTTDHSRLANRDVADQHPISAITGLEEALGSIEKPDPEVIIEAVREYMDEHPVSIEESDPTVPDWAKRPEKPTYTADEVGALPSDTKIPSKVSDLENDKGYLTKHQSLDGYATEEYVNQKISEAELGGEGSDIDLSSYYTKTQTDEAIQAAVGAVELLPGPAGPQGEQGVQGEDGYTPQKGIDYWTEEDKQEIIDEVPGADLTGYATEEFVSQKIAEAQLGGEEGVDLSAYYTKSETDDAIKTAVDAVELLPGPQGEKGDTGATGEKGADGYTPIKGVDYFDGQDGADGYTPVKGVDYFDGEDGVPCTHEWEGTVLKVTSASGTSSVDLRGPQGDKGEDGYTPQKGVDYFDGEQGPIGETGAEGPQGPAGADGHSPIITIIDGYWHIDGVNTGIGAAGPQGEQGPAGADGVPGIVKSETEPSAYANGLHPVWLNSNGSETVDLVTQEEMKDYIDSSLADAVDAALVQAKESGEFDGEDGYTPQKDIDYWTDEDKQEVVAEATVLLPTIHIKSATPTASDGKDGDLWLRVY